MNQFLCHRAEKMRLAAAGPAEGQHVFLMIQELSLEELGQLRIHLSWQPLAVEGLQVFLQRQLRVLEQAGCPGVTACFTLPFRQFKKVALVLPVVPAGAYGGFLTGVPTFEDVPGRVESRYYPALPHQTVRAVLPHTAFRCSSLQGMRFLPDD